jgi:molecular chaperone Hsp33
MGGFRNMVSAEHRGVEGPPFGNLVQPFQIETLGVRGRMVRLGAELDALLAPHTYPAPVAGLLSETLALAAALADGLKFDGTFILQTQSNGPVGLMVADVTSDGALRGYARFDRPRVEEAAAEPGGPVPKLLGVGHMAFTVDQGPDTERYQGITEIVGATMTDCAQNYFYRSEQLETAVSVAADAAATNAPGGTRASAFVIQRLPEQAPGDGRANGEPEADEPWRRAVILMSNLTPGEMLDAALSPSDVLYRLYHREGVRVFQPRALRRGCRCSRDRVSVTLWAFPRSEIEAMKVDGRVVTTCEFCKAKYVFDGADLDALYAS